MSEPATAGRLPDFILAGAMRSGTTALYRYLGAHPDVFIAPKELGFFTTKFDAGLDWYRDQFRDAGPARVLGEATADYFARETAMSRIADTLPQVRLVVSLRNPVDRAWSHYHLLRARARDTRTFAEAVEDETAALGTDDAASRVIYLVHSLYDAHLERALRLFDRDQIHVTVFERMASDPRAAYRSLCRFLGVDDTFEPPNLGVPVNAFVQFRSLRLRDFAKRLPAPVARVVGRLNSKGRGDLPELDAATRGRLDEFFAPRLRRIEELLGYPVPEWRPAGD